MTPPESLPRFHLCILPVAFSTFLEPPYNQPYNQPPSKSAGAVNPEEAGHLRLALKSFEDAIRVSRGKNMLALIGKPMTLFSLGRYLGALAGY
jgi:hypothetical protein